jgi:membrane protein DedA with SNARE-associated domain
MIGDNIGYLIGRNGGRWLLERPGRFASARREVLEIGEPFFKRHGPKAVFFGRWILGLRTWASWLAGASSMRWLAFAFWNAAGGIGWALTIGLLSYFLGSQVKDIFEVLGIFGLITIVMVLIGVYLLHRQHQRQLAAVPDPNSDRAASGSGTGG